MFCFSGGFRSLNQAQKEPKEDEAFQQQRQANIAEVARIKNEKKKIFGGGKQILDGDIAQLMGKGFSVDQATSALKNHGGDLGAALSSLYINNKFSGGQNNESRNTQSSRIDQNKRREKKNEETDVVQSRPSGPTTLFEFLQNQIPLSDEPENSAFSSSSANSNRSSKPSATVMNNSPTCGEQQRFRVDSGRSYKDGLSNDKRKFQGKDSGAVRYPNQRNSYSGQQQDMHRSKPPYNQPAPSNNRGQTWQDNYYSSKISDNSSKKSNESATNVNKTNNPKQGERRSTKGSFRGEANSTEPNQRAFSNGVKSQPRTTPPQSGEKVLARYWEDG
ncbi:tudor domain-containing protein 3-like, partial [Limulus polyphemus]|uniref:Tudor domain-containing protein 3-like n=1 Tax=Limulus polyphemus TaxID=6850 RepID=A0ABM1C2K2_LIMPO